MSTPVQRTEPLRKHRYKMCRPSLDPQTGSTFHDCRRFVTFCQGRVRYVSPGSCWCSVSGYEGASDPALLERWRATSAEDIRLPVEAVAAEVKVLRMLGRSHSTPRPTPLREVEHAGPSAIQSFAPEDRADVVLVDIRGPDGSPITIRLFCSGIYASGGQT